MTSVEPNWSRYLASVCEEYAHWWDKYTLTDVTGKRQTKAHKGDGFLLDLMAETVPEKEGENLPDSRPVEEQTEKVERFTVLEGLRKYAKEHVLLHGTPGSGKSTAMARLLLEEAEKTKDSQLEIPVLVELRYYDTSLKELIEDALLRHDPSLEIRELEQWLVQERLLLLLDGVNELPSEAARRDVLSFRRRYQKTTPMVFTTRKLSEGGDLSIRKKLTMQPLSEVQMCEFVQAYLPGQGAAMLAQLGERLREFGEVPLLLWMLCSVYAGNQQQMPTNLGGIFRQFTRLYDRKLKQDVPDPNRSKLFWQDLLQVLAFRMMVGRGDKEALVAISRREAEKSICNFYQASKGKDSLEQARLCLDDLLRHHLIQLGTTDSIQFRHQLIQEHYAAEELLTKLIALSDEELKWQYLNYLKWTESIALVAGLVSDRELALRLVRLALEIDYELGARLAGAIRVEWQSEAISLVTNLDVFLLLQVHLLGVTKSANAVSPLLVALNEKYASEAAQALGAIGSVSAVSGLLIALKDKRWNIRMKAAHALGEIRNVSALSGLLVALEDENRKVCEHALEALVKIDATDVVHILLKKLEEGDRTIRRQAAEMLGQTRSAAAISGLLVALKDEDRYVRSIAASALGKIGDISTTPDLLAMLEDEDQDSTHSAAATALGIIGSTAAIPGLLSAFITGNRDVSSCAGYALKKIGSETVVSGLLAVLKDDRGRFRRTEAADLLGEIGSESAVPGLLALLKYKGSHVAGSAAEALAKIGSESAISGVLAALEDSSTRKIAVYTLERMKNVSTTPALLVALRDSDSQVRYGAAQALSKMGVDDDAIAFGLLTALEDEEPNVRNRAAYALSKIGSPTAVPGLLVALKDKDSSVRSMVVIALGETGDVTVAHKILAALEDECSGVRDSAMTALESVGDATAMSKLLDIYRNRDEPHHTRVKALRVLGKIGGEAAASELLAISKNEHSFGQLQAIDALGKLGNTTAISGLLAMLKDKKENSHIRRDVVSALAHVANSMVVPTLLTTLESEDEGSVIRSHAAFALGRIGDAAAVPGLLTALEDKDRDVSREAASALESIGTTTAVSGLLDFLYRSQAGSLSAFNDLKKLQGRCGYYHSLPLISYPQSSIQSQNKVLVLAANPMGTASLRLDQEIRDIEEGLRRARHRDKFTLVQKWAVRPRDLRRAMLEERPQIVHFSGHGKGKAGLYFEDNQGHPRLITGEALANLFKLFAPKAQAEAQINCIFLNGCYSVIQAKEIAKHVPYVIGMSQSIGDAAAIEFAVGFYDALGNGESVEFAFEFARAAMVLDETCSRDVPVLLRSNQKN